MGTLLNYTPTERTLNQSSQTGIERSVHFLHQRRDLMSAKHCNLLKINYQYVNAFKKEGYSVSLSLETIHLINSTCHDVAEILIADMLQQYQLGFPSDCYIQSPRHC